MRIVYFLPGPLSRGPLGPEELVRREAFLNTAAFPGTKAVVRETEKGPASVESSAEEYLSVPGILDAAPRLEAEGFDAMIIGCFGDPGLAPARELVDFPVIGPGQAGALAAAQMGQRFAIITVVEEVVPAIRRQMRSYGLEGLVADIRAVDVPVLELRQRADQVLETMELEAHAALSAGADTIVLGCMTMGFLDVSRTLSERLGVPVINPVLAALKAAESFAATGVRPSPRAYPSPRKQISPATV
ncbi:aspartate/glutamate racemase family protein [Candidatus Palauibacter sp.]|uniref:aspartate/glutamate racemase family protein n=1 Tax=Candidatus Palauibacter sp. TaxID=3101350 RepID=UPI003B52A887